MYNSNDGKAKLLKSNQLIKLCLLFITRLIPFVPAVQVLLLHCLLQLTHCPMLQEPSRAQLLFARGRTPLPILYQPSILHLLINGLYQKVYRLIKKARPVLPVRAYNAIEKKSNYCFTKRYCVVAPFLFTCSM